MILDGVSYSAFIQYCVVGSYYLDIVEPYCCQSFLEQVPSTFVSGRLSATLCFPFNTALLVRYVLYHLFQDSKTFPLARVYQHTSRVTLVTH